MNASPAERRTAGGRGRKPADSRAPSRPGPAAAARRRPPGLHGKPDPQLSRSLEYGTAVLGCFCSPARAIGVAEFAQLIGISRSTAYRYAATLTVLGWLEQDSSRRYRLAPGAADVGLAALGLVAARCGSRAALQELRERTGHTASLGVLSNGSATYVQRRAGHRPGQFDADLGLRAGAHVPLHCTAIGKAMLARLPEEERDELLAGAELQRHAPNTITKRRELLRELARVDADGVAVCDEEQAQGVRSIAAPVHDPDKALTLAVEVNAPASVELGTLVSELAPHVRAAAERVQRELERNA